MHPDQPLASTMLTLAVSEMISHSVMLEGLRNYMSGGEGLVVGFKELLLGMQVAIFASPVRFWPVAWIAAWLAGLTIWAVRPSLLGAILRGVRDTSALVAALVGGAARPRRPHHRGPKFISQRDEFSARGATYLLTGVAVVLFAVLLPRGVVGGLLDLLGMLHGSVGARGEIC